MQFKYRNFALTDDGANTMLLVAAWDGNAARPGHGWDQICRDDELITCLDRCVALVMLTHPACGHRNIRYHWNMCSQVPSPCCLVGQYVPALMAASVNVCGLFLEAWWDRRGGPDGDPLDVVALVPVVDRVEPGRW